MKKKIILHVGIFLLGFLYPPNSISQNLSDSLNKNIQANLLDSSKKNIDSISVLSDTTSTMFKAFDIEALKTNDSLKKIVLQRKILLDSLKKSGTLPKAFLTNNSLVDSLYSDTIYYLTRDTMYEVSEFEDIVQYEAKDSINIAVPKKYISMYSGSKVSYQDIKAESYFIEFDQTTSRMYLYPKIDPTDGNLLSRPKLYQEGKVYLNDSVVTNIISKKALTYNSNFSEGDLYVFAQKTKKVNDDDIYGTEGWFTTCEYSDPHFSFRSKKLKFRKNKVAVGSTTKLTFEDAVLPPPFNLPFIFFPVKKQREQGVLFPQLITVDNQGFGIGLKNGGYYIKPSEHINAKVIGEIYSYGNWGLVASSEYKKNYILSSNFNFTYNKRNSSFPGELNSQGANNYNIRWDLNIDPKLIPTQSFSLSFNFGSSKFFSSNINPQNPISNFTNSTNSNVNYSKTFKGTPFRLNIGASQSQNNSTGNWNVSLPTINFNMNDIFPLQGLARNSISKYYEKLTIRYSSQYNSRANFYDTTKFSDIIDAYRWGISHNPSISLPLPQISIFRFTPGVRYSEIWTDRKTTKFYSDSTKAVEKKIEKGFYTYRNYSFSMSASTSIYGVKNFSKNSPLRGIRHVINPSVSLSYAPKTAEATYYNYVSDSLGTIKEDNYFSDALYGTFGRNKSASLGFGLNSNLEIKVRNRKDTALGYKKIKLIDNFSIGGSYNLIHEGKGRQRQLSDIALSMVTSIGQKLSINISGTWTLYGFDKNGGDSETNFAWNSPSSKGRFNIGRIKNISISTGTSFNIDKNGNSFFRGYTPYQLQTNYHPREPHLRELEQLRYIPGEYYDFGVKFSVSISYALRFIEEYLPDQQRFRLKIGKNSHSMNIGGSLALTKTTNITYQANLTITDFFKQITPNSLQIGIQKDIHCWTMSISIVPIGINRFLTFNINPKSPILQDLKITRNRSYLANQ